MSLLELSFSGAVLILAVALLRALAGRRLPRRMFCALWTVALLRLLVPVSLPSPASVYNAPALDAPRAAVSRLAPLVAGTGASFHSEAPAAAAGGVSVSAIQLSVWAVVWIAGAAALAACLLWNHWKARHIYTQALPLESPEAERWLAEHPLRRRVRLRCSDRVGAPLTYGALRPVILLPAGAALEGERLAYVLAHEWTHIRRWDVGYKWLLALALCAHWFNPAAWLLYVLADRDLELSCDEAVVRLCGAECRSDYALALLGLEERRRGPAALCSHFSKSAIEARVRAILKYRRASVAAVLAAVALAAGVSVAFATSADTAETSYAAQHYGPLMQFRFDGYEDLTVGEYRRRVQAQVGKTIDEDEYLILIDTILADNAVNRSALQEPDSWFLLNTLRLTVMDGWRDWYVDGNGWRNYMDEETGATYSLELGLPVYYELKDPEGITVRQRDAAFRGVIDGAWAFLESKTLAELEDEAAVNRELAQELARLEQQWETPALDLRILAASYVCQGDEWVSTGESGPPVEERGMPGSQADYDLLLALMTDGWQSESLEAFSNRLFRAAEEDEAYFEAAAGRVRTDLMLGDVRVSLTDEERSFLSFTLENSWAENRSAVESAYMGKTVDTRYDVDWHSIRTKTQPYYDNDLTLFEASAAFYFNRRIPDPAQVTVGERDARILEVVNAVKAWLAAQSDDQLAAPDLEQRFREAFDAICRDHSDEKIAFSADQFWLDVRDERDWQQEVQDGPARVAAGQTILERFGLSPDRLSCIDGRLEEVLVGSGLDEETQLELTGDELLPPLYFMSQDRKTLYGVKQDAGGTCWLYTFGKDSQGKWSRLDPVRAYRAEA